jgi:putative sigma-54 modulation protein
MPESIANYYRSGCLQRGDYADTTTNCASGLHLDRIGSIVNPAGTVNLHPPGGFAATGRLAHGFINGESYRRNSMNLTISGHHLEVTPALRNYVTTKLDRITRHFDQVVDVKVLLTVENQKEKERRQRAECNIHVKGSDMFAESSHSDLYAAVDDLVDKLDRQVVRHKDRLQNHHHEAPKRVM